MLEREVWKDPGGDVGTTKRPPCLIQRYFNVAALFILWVVRFLPADISNS